MAVFSNGVYSKSVKHDGSDQVVLHDVDEALTSTFTATVEYGESDCEYDSQTDFEENHYSWESNYYGSNW